MAEPPLPLLLSISCGGFASRKKVQCQQTIEVAFPDLGDQVTFGRLLRARRWVLSLVTPPGWMPAAIAPLCPTCTKEIYGCDFEDFGLEQPD